MTLTNGSFDAVARANLNAEQLIIYNALNTTYGNRNYLWDVNNVTSGSGGNGMSYEIPPEALQDEEFARMIEKRKNIWEYLMYGVVTLRPDLTAQDSYLMSLTTVVMAGTMDD